MLHEPAQQAKPDPASAYKTRLGVQMFILYCIVYVGFVAINVIKPTLMENIICCGLNMAVVYGFGLIIFAMILAMIFNSMCTAKEKELATKDQEVTK
ncbi:MAG: DUF485 domain-containing protein [Phycisphaerae bacterium]|nr:DUF485 domain-containing protein [Phycisphaerae bacterium]